MQISKYEALVKEAKANMPDLLKKTQKKLDSSKSKAEDYYILSCFWSQFWPKAQETFPDELYLEMITDHNSMMPMPESVCKQLVNMLFDIKHIDLLYDLPISYGLDELNEMTAEEMEAVKDEFIANAEEYFADDEEEE